jgi:hypothetical protein
MGQSTFDLTALSERLIGEDRFRQLAHKIRMAKGYASALMDLKLALDSLDALAVARPSEPQLDSGAVEIALLSNAIILYARATKTTSEKRPTIDLRSRFSDPEKKVHEELIDLRDKAIAHFGTGGSYQGLWCHERIILKMGSDSRKPVFVTERIVVDKSLVKRARPQIETAHKVLEQITIDELDSITTNLMELEQNGFFEKEISLHPIVLDEVFADSAFIRPEANNAGHAKKIVRRTSRNGRP